MKTSVRLKRLWHGIKHFVKSNKNDILFGAGVVTEVAAVVVTAKATIKTKQMADIESARIENYLDNIEDDAEVRAAKAEGRRSIYRNVTKQTIKNYIIPAGLTISSIAFYSKSHFNLKHELAATTAALAAEHALNQRLLAGANPETPAAEGEEPQNTSNAPYSAGIPNDLESMVIPSGVIIYDSDNGYYAERDGYAVPTTVFLSPTCMEFKKDPYSDYGPDFDWNVCHVKKILEDTVARNICLFGFVNLNEVRKHLCCGRSYKLEEAENYYLIFNPDRDISEQVDFRIYAACDEDGAVKTDCLYVDIFNTKVPKPGDLKEAKRIAIEKNPFKEK